MVKTDITKKGYSKDHYRDERVLELAKCMVDPLHFIQNYVMIQHPLEGRLPFRPYPFQIDMIKAFHEHRNVVALTSRQMGKCSISQTMISKNDRRVEIGSLIRLNFKEKIVAYLEQLLVKYATKEKGDFFYRTFMHPSGKQGF